eukprot:TRINITY_DN8450_c0_g2_i1.p1 TRINITY_DN8450_c0_g2~~TRINITY_DN8450_c0_g2_i1.p1  ORF type:complete len:101 (+),score=22.80 TRINITY_DN8450_c0_g2_i1:31-303(+)
MALGINKLDAAKKAACYSEEDWEFESFGSDDSQEGLLHSGGHLVVKLLECQESQGFPKLCKYNFKKVSWLRPKATRPSSREIYLICKDMK